MKKLTTFGLMILLMMAITLLLTACGDTSDKPSATAGETAGVQTETVSDDAENQDSDDDSDEVEMDVDLGSNDQSVNLPDDYPSNVLPIYKDSYIESVVKVEGNFTILCHSKDKPETVNDFYKKIADQGKINAEVMVDESYSYMGTLDDYTYQITIAPEEDKDNYETTYIIMIYPSVG